MRAEIEYGGLVRNALRAVDSLPAFNILGAVLIRRSAERARFGDRVAGTRVIRVRLREAGAPRPQASTPAGS